MKQRLSFASRYRLKIRMSQRERFLSQTERLVPKTEWDALTARLKFRPLQKDEKAHQGKNNAWKVAPGRGNIKEMRDRSRKHQVPFETVGA